MIRLFTTLLSCLIVQLIFAQDLSVKWTDQMKYDNKIDGFFNEYIGSNSAYVYAKFSNLAFLPKKQDKKIKVLALDKTTLMKVGEVQLLGYSRKKEDMKFYQSIVLENIIYMLFTKEEDKVVEVYAESYDRKLKLITKLKKIYEINAGKKGTDNLIVIYNKDIGNKILIGKEFATTQDNENLKMEYKLINEDFSLVSSNQVTLPIVVLKKQRRDDSFNNLVASYELGDDGKIYVQDIVKISDDEKKNLKKGEATTYPVVMRINPESGALQTYNIKFPHKNTFNFSTHVTKKGLKLYGFFSDLDKDVKGNDTHGIFYISMDDKNFTPKDSKFSYFDRKFLDQLYAADMENRKEGKTSKRKKKNAEKEKAKLSDDESIDDYYVIEKAIEDGDDLVLFCSIMYNWEETVCTTSSNGRQSCRTYYYCRKSNVTAFKLSNTGEIVWASNLDRRYTYSRWNVYDLNVTKKENEFFVVYGSAYQMNADVKNRKSTKSKDQQIDRFEYAVFDSKTGSYRKAEKQVNPLNVKKAERKSVDPSNIRVLDNTMYTSSVRIKYKPTFWLSCLFPCSFYITMYSGNLRRGTGYLGSISAGK